MRNLFPKKEHIISKKSNIFNVCTLKINMPNSLVFVKKIIAIFTKRLQRFWFECSSSWAMGLESLDSRSYIRKFLLLSQCFHFLKTGLTITIIYFQIYTLFISELSWCYRVYVMIWVGSETKRFFFCSHKGFMLMLWV